MNSQSKQSSYLVNISSVSKFPAYSVPTNDTEKEKQKWIDIADQYIRLMDHINNV